jgi:hypothetical protein
MLTRLWKIFEKQSRGQSQSLHKYLGGAIHHIFSILTSSAYEVICLHSDSLISSGPSGTHDYIKILSSNADTMILTSARCRDRLNSPRQVVTWASILQGTPGWRPRGLHDLVLPHRICWRTSNRSPVIIQFASAHNQLFKLEVNIPLSPVILHTCKNTVPRSYPR